MKRLEGSEGSVWTSNWTTLGGMRNQSHQSFSTNPRPGDLTGEPGFHFHQSLGFNERPFNDSYLFNHFIWFKFLVTEITVMEVHLPLWKCNFKKKISR